MSGQGEKNFPPFFRFLSQCFVLRHVIILNINRYINSQVLLIYILKNFFLCCLFFSELFCHFPKWESKGVIECLFFFFPLKKNWRSLFCETFYIRHSVSGHCQSWWGHKILKPSLTCSSISAHSRWNGQTLLWPRLISEWVLPSLWNFYLKKKSLFCLLCFEDGHENRFHIIIDAKRKKKTSANRQSNMQVFE